MKKVALAAFFMFRDEPSGIDMISGAMDSAKSRLF